MKKIINNIIFFVSLITLGCLVSNKTYSANTTCSDYESPSWYENQTDPFLKAKEIIESYGSNISHGDYELIYGEGANAGKYSFKIKNVCSTIYTCDTQTCKNNYNTCEDSGHGDFQKTGDEQGICECDEGYTKGENEYTCIPSNTAYECNTNECETHKHNCEDNNGTFRLTGNNQGTCECANGYVNSAADEYTCIKKESGKKYPTVTVNEPNNMLVGDTFDISPSAKYNNTNVEGTYKYEGYDSNIVTVSTNGVITAKKVGATTIKLTFSSKNTSEYINTITKYVKVKVVECNGTNDPSDKDADGYGWADPQEALSKGKEDCSKKGLSALYHDWGGDGCYNYYCRESSGGNTNNNNNNNNNNNPKTGNSLIYVVWTIGIVMIGYSIWYFKENSKTNN